MKEVYRDIRPFNSDLLQEEMVAEFGDRFSSVNSGGYAADGKMGFMFVVVDDFSKEEETRLTEILINHDEKKLTDRQMRNEQLKEKARWLVEEFDPTRISDAIAQGKSDLALKYIAEFIEATHTVMRG